MIYKGKKNGAILVGKLFPENIKGFPRLFFFQEENTFYSKCFVKNKLEDLHKMMKKTYFSCQLKNLDIGNARKKYLFRKVVVQT